MRQWGDPGGVWISLGRARAMYSPVQGTILVTPHSTLLSCWGDLSWAELIPTIHSPSNCSRSIFIYKSNLILLEINSVRHLFRPPFMLCTNIFDKWAVIALIISVLFLKKIKSTATSSKKMVRKVDDFPFLFYWTCQYVKYWNMSDQFFTQLARQNINISIWLFLLI